MNKNKILLTISIASICATMATVFIAGTKVDNSLTFVNGTEAWYHYEAVDPTETRHGSKEFWGKASDYCATTVLEQPEGTIIETRDFSLNEHFSELALLYK